MKRVAVRVAHFLVSSGLHPSILKYKVIPQESPFNYLSNQERKSENGSYHVIHTEIREENQLPVNIQALKDLPDDSGWWGYSFRDVPNRVAQATSLFTVYNATVVSWVNRENTEYWPAILTNNGTALQLRELILQREHKRILQHTEKTQEIERGFWILERVFRNHSHWLTAHLPKVIYLKEHDLLDEVILPPPEYRTDVMNSSLNLLDIDPEGFKTFDPEKILKVRELQFMETDRFRPELLRSVREAYRFLKRNKPYRKLYISRGKAQRRRLVNEEKIFSFLNEKGYEKVFLEELSFKEQIQIMQEARVVVAPHGAGLTNILFCGPDTHVVEIADLDFPNPNFYAIAAAMDHNYWIVKADSIGDKHPLEKDLTTPPESVQNVIEKIQTQL
jgi:hypothetical protein